MYLHWQEKNILDFSSKNITELYNEGYVFTRRGKGVMHQTRSIRIDLSKFELSSESRRILRKTNDLRFTNHDLPYQQYHWSVGKMAKDFYDTKFGKGTMSANKVKELLTDGKKSNFNVLLVYSVSDQKSVIDDQVGYAICYANDDILHYSYPFYDLRFTNHDLPNIGMSMMLRAIIYAQEKGKKYIYLGSAQRPTDTYKLQFEGLEWWDGKTWQTDISRLKNILTNKTAEP